MSDVLDSQLLVTKSRKRTCQTLPSFMRLAEFGLIIVQLCKGVVQIGPLRDRVGLPTQQRANSVARRYESRLVTESVPVDLRACANLVLMQLVPNV